MGGAAAQLILAGGRLDRKGGNVANVGKGGKLVGKVGNDDRGANVVVMGGTMVVVTGGTMVLGNTTVAGKVTFAGNVM